MAELEPINALADAAPGFVWRLQTDEGDATSIRPFQDENLVLNMSVWEDVESLRAFVYRTRHVDVYRARSQWFENMEQPHQVLWWVDQGHVPSIDEAIGKLEHLRANGPSREAFTFATAARFAS